MFCRLSSPISSWSGDNALVIGMAAAGLAPQFRRRAIMIGMAMAAIMRILFAVIASYLIAIKGILLIGGGIAGLGLLAILQGPAAVQQ